MNKKYPRNLTEAEFMAAVRREYRHAKKLHPNWPRDIVHAAAIVNEEAGELIRAAVQNYYGDEATQPEVITEAVQTAAMAMRLAVNCTLLWPPTRAERRKMRIDI